MRRLPVNRALAAATVLPVLLGTLVLWSLGDRIDNVDAVPAAVVNLDEPVHTGTGKDRQIVFAGRLLAAGLTSADDQEDHPLSWRLTSPDEASAGLRDGDYYAVITIPKDFSRTVAGLTRDDPETARITVRSNDAGSALVGVVGDQVGEVATAELNQRITATFLEGVYERTGRLKASLGRAEDGAGRLADGAVRLGEGTARLSSGAAELSGGLDDLSGGAARLAGGADRLAQGADRLRRGTDRLGSGARQLADGTGALAEGLDRLHRRTRPLPDQTRHLADGADRLADGVDGWSKVLRGWKQACTSDPVLAGSHAQLCAATIQAVGADDGNARAMVSGSRALADGTERLAGATPRLVDAVRRASDGADRLHAGGTRLAAGVGRVGAGAKRLDAGSRRLSAGAGRLSEGADRAGDGAARLATGSVRLAGGSERLTRGSRTLATGLGEGAERIPAMPPQQRAELARTVAQPVVSDTDRIAPSASASTSLLPAVVALALWLGAFLVYLVRRALPARTLASATSPGRVAVAGWLPAFAVGLAQSLLVLLATGLLAGGLESPVAVAAFLLVPAAVFAALNQALVAALGRRRGWMASISLLVLQAVSLGALLPVVAAPGPIRWLSGLLPVSLAADGVGDLAVPGYAGSAVASAVGLLAWGAAALAVTTLAARRRQRVSVSDVRRRVGTPA